MISRFLPKTILFVAAGAELFFYLNRGVLYWDEAIYAQVAKETVERHEWLTLHWNGIPWFDKPPLYMWGTALLFQLFSVSEFWARAISATAGVGVVLVSYEIARTLYGISAGAVAGLILLSTPLFVVYARFGTTDMLLTFFITLTIYACLRAARNGRFWLLAWMACTFAILTKGAAGLAAPAVLGLMLLIEREMRQALRRREFWAGLGGTVAVVATWHVGMYLLHGEQFVDNYFRRHLLKRSLSDLNNYNYGYTFYLGILWEFCFPWICLIPVAVIFEVRNRKAIVLIVFAATILGVYTCVRTKFHWYILPALPPLAIVSAGFLTANIGKLTPPRRNIAYAAVALIFVVGLWKTFPLCLPQPQMESAATLARRSASDEGPIAVCPDDLGMTVLFYSGRHLCANPILTPLAYNESTKCEFSLPGDMIFQKSERPRVEAVYRVSPISEEGDLEYAAIEGARQ